MTVQRVNLKDLGKEIQGFTEKTLNEQRNAVVNGLARSMPGLIKRSSHGSYPPPSGHSTVDTGHYAASWRMSADEKSAIIGNIAPHAPIIEFGARPGFTPPLAPLLAWAKRVLQDPSQPPKYSDAVQGLARYTQNKIRERGIAPRQVLRASFDDFIMNIGKELDRIG